MIAYMIGRRIGPVIEERLSEVPAVVLLGPRQTGKTTLALEIPARRDAVYLDLESDSDRAKLVEPELHLSEHGGRLVVLDEIHRAPGIFPTLRGMIDRSRREGRSTGRYLLLGSASLDLLRQSGKTLAGRASYFELNPFDTLEVDSSSEGLERVWVRGGFPESLLAPSGARSMRWRLDFVRSYLERDIPQLGPRVAAERLRRMWTMLAHHQGGNSEPRATGAKPVRRCKDRGILCRSARGSAFGTSTPAVAREYRQATCTLAEGVLAR